MGGWPWRDEPGCRRTRPAPVVGARGFEQAHDYAAGKDPMERRERFDKRFNVKSIDEEGGAI